MCFLKKKTVDEFENEVRKQVGNEYIFLDRYINSKTKIKVKHNVCGYEYDVEPNAFLRGHRCPKCENKLKVTTEIYKKKVYNLVKEEYTVLGEYVNSSTKIRMRHNKCGCEYEVKPNTFISGHRCPNCYRSEKYTTLEFKRKIYDLVKDRYTMLSEYINSNTKIKMKHNICGTEYEVLPFNFLNGNRCPKCSLQLKRSLPEEVVAFFVSKYFEIEQSFRPQWLKFSSGQIGEIDIWIPKIQVGIEYDGKIHNSLANLEKDKSKNEIISKNKRCKKLIRIREYTLPIFDLLPAKIKIIQAKGIISLTSRKGIPFLEEIIKELLIDLGVKNPDIKISEDVINKCQLRIEDYYKAEGLPIRTNKLPTRKSNTAIFKDRVYKLVGDEYSVLGEYTYALEKIKMRHNKCGYEYDVKPNVFLNGCRCPKCANKLKVTTEIYKKKVYNLVKEEYSVIGEYVNNRTKIKMRHNKCGYEYEVKPNSFLSGRRCPKCANKNYK